MSSSGLSFTSGQLCSGRVVNIYKENLIVELEQGILGRVFGGARQTGAKIGDVINVVVLQNGNDGITLALSTAGTGSRPSKSTDASTAARGTVTASGQPQVTGGSLSIQPWSNWMNMQIGHQQAITAMSALRDHTDAFLKELIKVRTEYQSAKERSQQTYDTETAAARNEFEQKQRNYIKECADAISATENRSITSRTIVVATQSFLDKLPQNGVDSVRSILTSRIGHFEKVQGQVDRAIQRKTMALEQLRDCQIADAERDRNAKLDRLREEQIQRDAQTERRFVANYKAVRDNRNKDIYTGFNKTTIHEYRQKIKSSRFNAQNYECPEVVPEYIMLGDIGIAFPVQNQNQDQSTVAQGVILQTAEVGEKGNREYIVKIPYAQRLSDGISLLIRYSPPERVYVQSLMQPLLLKLFLSFPAGKLEATMIDPLELGASFPDIPKLAEGPNSARIIDTKIWSKEKDIEVAIGTLRQRLENMTQAYGGDKESRLKKEVVRVLAITDFPVGFNDTALKDLHAIVRNSASLGVCVLICANEAELETLKIRNGTLVDEIRQSVIETKSRGEKLDFVGNSRLFLQLDDMRDVDMNKEKILSFISSEIEHTQLKVEHFSSMFQDDIYDSNNWFTGSHDEVAVPIGIKGANTIVKMVVGRGGGSTEHHALIAGQTGAGKSTLLHTLILSTLLSYSPDEVQMYLLDFKEGVEFSQYTKFRLPSLRVVAINSEREFGLTVLKELCTELETRTKHFTRYGVSDINGYVRLQDVPKVPKLLLIFDEVQELFRNSQESDSISAECLSCINKLVMQGRAMGIHIILACQDFSNCSGLSAFFSQMAIRIAVKGSVNGAASILDANNAGIHTLQNQPAGAAIYNGGAGVESANNFFQISYITEAERLDLLERLDTYFTDPAVADLYKDAKTRVLLTNAEDDIHNCFNQLILNGANAIYHLAPSKDGYGLLLGQGFGKKSIFMPEIRSKDRENLLVVSKDEKIALSIFELSAMSVLFEELHTTADKANALVYIVDLCAEELSDGDSDFEYFENQFPQQIKIAKIGDVEELISNLYEIVIGRSEGIIPAKERIFLLFFGLNRAKRLRNPSLYEDDRNGDLSPLEMLQKVLTYGPKNNVNSIVWSESRRSVENMLGSRYESLFDKRIAYGLDAEAMDDLVGESDSNALRGKTAVYMDVSRDVKNTHFRPYDIPAKVWVERYAEAYDEVVRELEGIDHDDI